MLDHVAEFPSPTEAAKAVAKRNGVGAETVRRWYLQAKVDAGQRGGATSEDLTEIKELKSRAGGLEEDDDTLRPALIFFAGELDPGSR